MIARLVENGSISDNAAARRSHALPQEALTFGSTLNIKFQRAVDRFAGVPICALLSLINRFGTIFRTADNPAPPRRILVILLSEMGSLVLAHPMFVRLKQRYPDASLHIMLFGKNREVLDLMEVIPQENVLTINDRALSGFARDSLAAIGRMRALKFDVVIDCELFSRVSSIFSYLSGAPVRVGFHRHTQEGLYRGSFINRAVLYNPYRHLSQQFLAMVAAIESAAEPKAKEAIVAEPVTPPALNFADGELQQIFAQLHDDFPAIKEKKLVLVYPSGGILPIRAWPMENYRQLCASLLGDGYAVGIIGMKEDKPYGQDIVAHCQHPHCADLTGYTKSVRHLLALFHRASLLVTNDGGPGQFAALTPISSLVFFGPETPVLYGSLARNSHCFFAALPCSPCLTAYNHRSSPCDGDNLCLKRITPEQVLAKARALLEAPGHNSA
ncbi:MAG: glycosyl transferase family protein [Gallionellaceae bacterium]|nr:MAG: glycosyl transferase family protein [Gallionellaceae bacterium]